MPPAPGFADATVLQVAHLSLGGNSIRLHFSNAYGTTPLTLESVLIAKPDGPGKIDPRSKVSVTFGGKTGIAIPPGAEMAAAVDLTLFKR